MAIDNLNYYSSGLPAGQQTDKYSSQPGCLKSKNLDIFSSSKSVKATAWSELTTEDADIVKQDGKLILKDDGKVYERENGVDTLVIDPTVDFPVYNVSYTGPSGTYAPAERGTSQDMVAKYEGNEWESFVVYTDRSSLVYSKRKLIFNKSFTDISSHWTYVGPRDNGGVYSGYEFNKKENDTASSANIYIQVDNVPFSKIPLRIIAKEHNSNESTISLNKISCRHVDKLYYDAQLDGMIPNSWDYNEISFSGDISQDGGVEVEIPTTPISNGYTIIALEFKWTQKPGGSYKWNYGELYIDINGGPTARKMMKHTDGTLSDGDSNYYYSYLPLRERKLVDVGAYAYSSSYWMKGTSFQPLYKWNSSWVEKGAGNREIIYDFITDMGWESDVSMDVIGMTVWNEQVYMIGNLDGNGYIIPCDLSGGRGTPFIAYGCTFRGVTNIDYLLYLVGEDRGISTLWVFNQQELVPAIGGNKENESKDIVGVDEQYRFDGKILNWRKNLILSTTDNRIFQYGQTYGGKGGAFIHELPGTIKEIKADGNDLTVNLSYTIPRPIDPSTGGDMIPPTSSINLYSEDGEALAQLTFNRLTNKVIDLVDNYGDIYGFTALSLTLNGAKLKDDYKFNEEIEEAYIVGDYLTMNQTTTLQDDTPIKNYNSEWMAEYPIVIGNHLLEKEESDLFVSYILPSADTSLEFWGMANHYHFRTFTSEDDYTFDGELSYKLKGATGNYELKFIERNGNEYTFRLVGNLPVQTTSDMKITDSEGVELINYSDFNHFRKIGEITTTEYKEGEFRFHNLNNKLELPRSHSLQIMVKGKGNQNYTPELFALDLIANQRERG